jgi:hypothetical protein
MRPEQTWTVPAIAALIAGGCLWLIPAYGSDQPGWDATLLGQGVTAAVAVVVGAWGIQQAISAQRQADTAEKQEAGLREQNQLLRHQLDHAKASTQLAEAAADQQRQIAQDTLRTTHEQRLDAQMPTVSLRLKTFQLQPTPLFKPGPDGSQQPFHPTEDTPLGAGMEIVGRGTIEVQNHGSAPVMLNLLPPCFGDHDTQPTNPLGATGSVGLWGAPQTSRGDIAEFNWEAFASGDLMLELIRQGGWAGGSWDLVWGVEVTNLQNTVRDIIQIRAYYKPFRQVDRDGVQQWVWSYTPAPFYGAFGTEHRRDYLGLNP